MYVNEVSFKDSNTKIKFEDVHPFTIDPMHTDPGRALCVYDLKSKKYVRFLLSSVENVTTTQSK